MATVAMIAVTPVKGLALLHPDEVELTATGVEGNRRYFLVDDDGRLFNGVQHGPLVRVRAAASGGALTLRFPDGRVVDGEVAFGAPIETLFYGRTLPGHVVRGPWADSLSAFVGRPLRLVRTVHDDAWDVRPVTIVSRGSCERLGEELAADVDPRRFRMVFTLDGLGAHEEDTWEGFRVRVGEAELEIGTPVPRCVVTTHDPDTGLRTLGTLSAIKRYRGVRASDGTSLDFGVYARVVTPGRVRVGDAVEPR